MAVLSTSGLWCCWGCIVELVFRLPLCRHRHLRLCLNLCLLVLYSRLNRVLLSTSELEYCWLRMFGLLCHQLCRRRMRLLPTEDLGLIGLHIYHRAERLCIFGPVCRFEFVWLIGSWGLFVLGIVCWLGMRMWKSLEREIRIWSGPIVTFRNLQYV